MGPHKSGRLCLVCSSPFLYSRGLCQQHYSKYSRAVKKGLLTWEQLIERGRALPKNTDNSFKSKKEG